MRQGYALPPIQNQLATLDEYITLCGVGGNGLCTEPRRVEETQCIGALFRGYSTKSKVFAKSFPTKNPIPWFVVVALVVLIVRVCDDGERLKWLEDLDRETEVEH